ncbi:MAG TPA: sulfatase [Candidatus Eisenbacteria bacterium]|nr:sulfatase [Candidatus Eisenbacteria bacterium]
MAGVRELRVRTVAIWMVLSLAACSSPPRDPRKFNVLMIALDACRADAIHAYGFERETTPELDALARHPDTTVFRRHYVQASWTKPSTASLFTGRYVSSHGVYLGVSLQTYRNAEGAEMTVANHALSDDAETLAERLAAHGFETFAIMMNHHLAPVFGLAQGFGTVVPFQVKSGGDSVRAVRALDFVRAQRGRFFGYVHLHGCHFPFPYWRRDGEYMTRYAFPYDEAARRQSGVDFIRPKVRQDIADGTLHLTPEDVRFLHLVYEAQLRRADDVAIGPLLRGLRDLGVFDDTLIVVTADHGEELYDHAGYGHGHALWEELLHVPFIVKFPHGRRPAQLGPEVTHLSRAIDVLPSLLSLVELPVDAGLQGADIFGGVFPRLVIAEMAPVREVEGWAGHRRAFLDERYKVIETDGGPLLFDLALDPGERTNVASDHPEIVARLVTSGRAEIDRAAGGPPMAREVKEALSPDAAANLRELGYLEGQ